MRGDNPRALVSGLSPIQKNKPLYNYFIPPASVSILLSMKNFGLNFAISGKLCIIKVYKYLSMFFPFILRVMGDTFVKYLFLAVPSMKKNLLFPRIIFPLRVNLILEESVSLGSKQEVTKVVSICKHCGGNVKVIRYTFMGPRSTYFLNVF